MNDAYEGRIVDLKRALLEFLGGNGRHYGDMSRTEQSVEDLTQALNTRLDQLLLCVKSDAPDESSPQESPRDKLAHRLMATAALLTSQGKVDGAMADQFDQALDAFDLAADLKRQAATAKDGAESAAIRHKRDGR